MDQDTAILLGYASLMVINRLVFFGNTVVRFRVLFYALQIANIAACSFFFAWGMPGFAEDLKIINYMLGGLLLLRTVKNNQSYAKLLRKSMEGEDLAHLERRQAVLDKLKAESEEE